MTEDGTAIRIGNCSGFYGDRLAAMREMLDGGPLDVLTGDYLAELTMLILARDRLRDPALGYARTFLRQLEDCLGAVAERGVRLVVNAGGLNPAGLAAAVGRLAERLGVPLAVGHVLGDELPAPDDALARNAYLGCWGIVECLRAGAEVVVTGRVTDASLVIGPAAWHHGWARDDWDALAGATVAGHVLECGAQATGGNFSFFRELDLRHPGFPLAEIEADGSALITKHPGTGGAVTAETVTAQLLYETGPQWYAGPDVDADLGSVQLTDDRPDQVRIRGVRGAPPRPELKVGTVRLAGFRNATTFVLTGLDIEAKAALVRTQVEAGLAAARPAGMTWTLARTDHPDADTEEAASALLHLVVRDPSPEPVGRAFSRVPIELALASYPGFHVTAPPGEASPYGVFAASFVPQSDVDHRAVTPDGTVVAVPPPPGAPGPGGDLGPAELPEADLGPTRRVPEADLGPAELPEAGLGPTRRVPEADLGPTRRVPLGTIAGARSGDKGGSANIGLWFRTDAAYGWFAGWLTADRLDALVPEAAGLPRMVTLLPNLRAVNIVLDGILGEGVAASTRFDPQGKGLGEWLRSRLVDVPEVLL